MLALQQRLEGGQQGSRRELITTQHHSQLGHTRQRLCLLHHLLRLLLLLLPV
jgi:hypothetical protein